MSDDLDNILDSLEEVRIEDFEKTEEIGKNSDEKFFVNRYVIGDIHGNYKALIEVLEQVKPLLVEYDEIIFLGDYVDRYPESRQVIKYLKDLKEEGLEKNFKVFLIRGNHDQWFIDYANSLANPSERFRFYTIWQENGGRETLSSFDDEFEIIEYGKWLKENTILYHTNYGKIVVSDYTFPNLYVHGGLTCIRGHRKQKNKEELMTDRSLWKMANLACKFRNRYTNYMLPIRMTNYSNIIIGHSATLYYGVDHPMIRCNILNMDSGAGFSEGRLSCIRLNDFRLFQSKKSKELYPEHNPKCIYFNKDK